MRRGGRSRPSSPLGDTPIVKGDDVVAITISGAHLVPHAWNPRLTDRNFWLRLESFPHAGLVAGCSAAPAGAAVSWSITNGTATVASGAGPTIRVPRPHGPARLAISCSAGPLRETAVFWVVRGRILFHIHGQVSIENERQRVNAVELHRNTSHRPGLGVRAWADTQVPGRTNYGACIEIVGAIEPPDIPLPFHLVRRTVSASTWTSDSSALTPPSVDDTTGANAQGVHLQDMTPSARGRVYDFDAPGSHFEVGDAVDLMHRWNLTFEQMLVIGPLQRGPGAVARAVAQHRTISPPRRWHARFSASVAAQGPRPDVEVSGYVGP
jgi:hypothetical protein